MMAGAAHAMTCGDILAQDPHHMALEQAYALFLQLNREAMDGPSTAINFKGKTYKIVDYLGSGIEGDVFRVEDLSGKESIVKIFRKTRTRRSFVTQLFDYYKMNRIWDYPYKILSVDFRGDKIQFEDIRAIPIELADILFKRVGSPETSTLIWGQVARQASDPWIRNVVFDIDRRVLVMVDPH